jgi:hypothetical protein
MNPNNNPSDQPKQTVSPSELAKQIYPDATAVSTPGPEPPPIREQKEEKNKTHSLIGVALIAAFNIFYSSYYLWWGLSHKGSLGGFNIAIYIANIILAAGLLARVEIARLLFVIFGIIALILQSLSLLVLSTFTYTSKGFKVYFTAVLTIQIIVLIYLTRPSVKDQFS